jgi:hypothetical protein
LLDGLDMPVEAYQHIVRAVELHPPPSLMHEARRLVARIDRRGLVPKRFRGDWT